MRNIDLTTDRSQKIVVSLVSAIVASLVGVFVVSSASTSAVTVCVDKSSSSIRYSKDGVCEASENLLRLNEQGSTGATGPTGAGYSSAMTIREVSETSILRQGDEGKFLYAKYGTSLTVPTNASVPFAIGSRIEIGAAGEFFWVVPSTGVTINGGVVQVELDNGKFQIATLIKIATDEWIFLAVPNES